MPEAFNALVVRERDGAFVSAVEQRRIDELPDGELLVRVEYSSLNYKDAMSASGNRGVTRNYPHTPGVDAAGVVEVAAGDFRVGDEVVVSGYDLGMNTAGGFAGYVRVPAAWAMPLPRNLSTRQAMQLGTAGLTTALCIDKLQSCGVELAGAPVAVTGATGGVGCTAVALLARLGARVTAITGKEDAADFLTGLGAEEIVSRGDFLAEARPLQKPRWKAAVDVAGGPMLAQLLSQLEPGGACACCGLVAGAQLELSIFPFILRGVSLLGVDSVQIPLALKAQMFERLAGDWRIERLDELCTEIGLEQLPAEIDRILAGQQRGKVLVRVAPRDGAAA